MLAKKAYYQNRFKTAYYLYSDLIKLERENVEALFHLGQIASSCSMWKEASRTNIKILDVFPGNKRAREALKMTELRGKKASLRNEYDIYRSKSKNRDIDIKRQCLLNTLSLPLENNNFLPLRLFFINRSFSGSGDIYENRSIARIDLSARSDWEAGAYYGMCYYGKSHSAYHPLFGSDLTYFFNDLITLGAFHDRSLVEYNKEVITDGLYTDLFKLRSDLDLTRRI